MTRVDILLAQIELTLAECDARRLPPLTSEPAAAVLDFMGQAGLELTPWQRQFVGSMYADPDAVRRFVEDPLPERPYRSMRMEDWPPSNWPSREPRRPWWRRWWSR